MKFEESVEENRLLKSIPCTECKGVFETKEQLEGHNRLVHLKTKPPYNCDYCDLPCSNKSNLETHLNTVHLKIEPYICKYCNLSLLRQSHLNTHLKKAHQN